MATKKAGDKKELALNLFSIFVVISCSFFIMQKITEHTEKVQKIQNELDYEKLIYQIQTGVRK